MYISLTFKKKNTIEKFSEARAIKGKKRLTSLFILIKMLYITTIISILEVLIVTLPILFVVAFVTVAERKTMASMQRRLGPNIVGYYGLLQAFADALKLLLKEYVSPTQANLILFFLGPIITLIFALLGFAVIPFAPGLAISDFDLGILYTLAMSSLATYGILLAGWSANSKYAFLGSLRSTAQLISYELILSSVILLVVLLTSNLNLTVNIEAQKVVWFIVPLFPIFLIFFIGSVAETNRAPFDLAEANYNACIKTFKDVIITFILTYYSVFKYTSFLYFKQFSTTNTNNSNSLLNPHWITGFTDAEGCFSIKFTRSNDYKLKWRTQAQFQIKLHERDLVLLNRIKDFFGVGTIVKDNTYIVYSVKTIENLTRIIIPHFNNYPLLTKKFADFYLFEQIVLIMARKEHLTKDNFDKILSLRANLNLGMSEKLRSYFPNIVPVIRPEVSLRKISSPQWLTGFIDGEGCFFINVQKYNYKLDPQRTDKIRLTFQITQHSRDTLFMESIIKYLDCGRISDRYKTPTVDFRVNQYNDIQIKVIPFLEKYPLQSVKQKDFKDFCKAANLIANRQHLTLGGIEEIKIIKNEMNKKRVNYF